MAQLIKSANVVHVLTPYSAGFVYDLKKRVPASERKWDGVSKAWLVDAKNFDVIEKLAIQYFGNVQVVNASGSAQATMKRYDSFLVKYVARVRDDGYALAWANDGFTVRLSERAMREFFEMGAPIQSEPTKAVPSDFYQVLGLKPDAADGEIKQAWRRGVMTWHPDRSPEPDAREWFEAIQAAYEVLKEPAMRVKYDAGRRLEAFTRVRTKVNWTRFQSGGYVPPVRCGVLTFEAVQGVYLDVSRILRWDDDVRVLYGLRCIRVATPKRSKSNWGLSQSNAKLKSAEDFFDCRWEAI